MSENVNDLLSDWLDDEEPNSSNTNDVVVEKSCEAVGDTLLVDSLLYDLSHRDEQREAVRIRSLMLAIEDKSKVANVVETFDNHMLADSADNVPKLMANSASVNRRRFAILTSALSIAAAVMVMLVVFGPQQNVSAAMASLEKVLEAAAKPFDRTYRLVVVEEYSDEQASTRPFNESRRPVKFEDNLDGALLHVGGVDRFVFVRELKDGRKRVSGCDGEQSWAFREDSPVHISSRLQRFRGGLPGQQHSLGFTDLYSQLTILREGYVIEVSLINRDESQHVLHRLTGEHRMKGVGGPKRMQIDFNPDTGTIHRMLLDGLPRDRGGPKSVEFVLVSQADVGDEFYSHESHHESGRRVKSE